jgi:ArsR family transcriptional regulator
LSVLKNAGLVDDEKRGNSIFYSLRVPCIMQFMGCLEDVLSSNAKQHMEILKCCKK